ncbi:TetR/AcrR family transcriptional regulator [Saccharopolyspora sp. 7B]|uniref:TetR/AcrR family transcriptional regulator n=2 Tax=unclassified Saccharopolyspora TaxID=2646250 RepID=UPI001CD1E60C|nr:TetR/AcrR family transcriptional regulator [Saccharopolyspora sp. 7B]MCA1282180.1 TetR/AcrR family transcriptional regulator [Saccharopolyspora sp. 7B]
MTSQTARQRVRGELRQEILDAAERLIRDEGFPGLTMRKLAGRLGCAPMSLYSYFADKQAILRALATQGFERVAADLAGTGGQGGVDGLRELMLAFVRYAQDDPVHYRALFMSGTPADKADCPDEVNPAYRLVAERVAGCLEQGVLAGDATAISTVLWTTAHGAASVLVTFGHRPADSPDAYAAAVVDNALAGLRARPATRL